MAQPIAAGVLTGPRILRVGPILNDVATLFEGTFSAAHPDHLSESMKAFRAHGAEELFATFVKNHTVFDPTLTAYWGIVQYYDPATKPDPRMRYVAASMFRMVTPGAARETFEVQIDLNTLRQSPASAHANF